MITDDDGFISIIEDANIVFHEAGHLWFAIFGDSMGLYGGRLGQLLPPVVGHGYLQETEVIDFRFSGAALAFREFLRYRTVYSII